MARGQATARGYGDGVDDSDGGDVCSLAKMCVADAKSATDGLGPACATSLLA